MPFTNLSGTIDPMGRISEIPHAIKDRILGAVGEVLSGLDPINELDLTEPPERSISQERGRTQTSISIKPFNPETHPSQDGVTIDLGMSLVVEGHDQPFELSTAVTVEKGAHFRTENTEGTLIFDSKSTPSVEPSASS